MKPRILLCITISLLVLTGLFPVSVFVGWLIAGRVLRPIGRVTQVARDIQATDLSRRIELDGPEDELKQLADTFDGMLDRLESAAESQRAFIHEASHELRNPLAIMATNLDVAIAGDDPADLRSAAAVVRSSVDRISHTVDSLLAYARREAPVPIASIVDETVSEFAVPAGRRNQTIRREVDDAISVTGDRAALRQIIENLLSNALRHTEDGGEVRVGGGEVDGWVWLAVADDGVGIEPASHDLVWQRYWRAQGKGDVDRPRRGLGLAVVRQVAEAHAGRVGLRSEPGAGATFWVWIPQDRSAQGEPRGAPPLL